MFGLHGSELLIILIIVLVLFGGKKIPEIFSGLGKGIRSFRKSMNTEEDSSKEKETNASNSKSSSNNS